MNLTVTISVLSALAALAAAFCWFMAGTKKVSPAKAEEIRNAYFKKHGRAVSVAWTLSDGSDMEFTLNEQSKWNRNGAIAAGIAALLQAASTIASI